MELGAFLRALYWLEPCDAQRWEQQAEIFKGQCDFVFGEEKHVSLCSPADEGNAYKLSLLFLFSEDCGPWLAADFAGVGRFRVLHHHYNARGVRWNLISQWVAFFALGTAFVPTSTLASYYHRKIEPRHYLSFVMASLCWRCYYRSGRNQDVKIQAIFRRISTELKKNIRRAPPVASSPPQSRQEADAIQMDAPSSVIKNHDLYTASYRQLLATLCDANSDQDGLGMIDSEWLQTVPTVLRELLDVTEKIQSTSKAATDLQAKAESSLMRQVFAAYKGNMTDEEWKQLAITIAEREKTIVDMFQVANELQTIPSRMR